MDWREGLNRILRLDEQELALWENLMMTAPNESMRRMLRNAIAREREEMRMIRELMMGGPMDP
ncbi:MAG: hypothetical protein PWR06_2607 [Thermoanaerobacteraceae bacterium]|uniref:Uncharacterized protein n=1 Tax=Biomaibacter acetigenes TaxID=2316383 RepID=A0A3G2R3G4_9FIRM|nr:hypothetical protein [Biomaibacter acetigenes]MDK2879891.1 hypothetical protein [Thermoanaerobacteraceae bacterium]RKL63201.1 hypothetical protein DXT63_07285 [Thermoanaerobacteraceae bacterium SP2]AYO30000.1 hypothetical protein D2962_04710 [Biomaibacter acetigenes]MDN5301803.1 hypothetical protein [Thermoanaerobacteraceae bacterium]MDN5311211.1 hypothetical protein [Thermoanaerobacteraceae bacterium]